MWLVVEDPVILNDASESTRSSSGTLASSHLWSLTHSIVRDRQSVARRGDDGSDQRAGRDRAATGDYC